MGLLNLILVTNDSAVTVSSRSNHPIKESNIKYTAVETLKLFWLCVSFFTVVELLSAVVWDYFAYGSTTVTKETKSQKSFILVCSRVSVFWVLEQTYPQMSASPSHALCSFPLPSASNRWVVHLPSYCATRLSRGKVYWRLVHSQHC